jgi:tetratricopeptide (TPR) repeat protein
MAYGDKGDFDRAIADFTTAIDLNPELALAYYNRGEAWLHLGKWADVKSDLTTARNMGVDIIALFHNLYSSVADFESRHGVKLPEDMAGMLTPRA